VALPAPPVAWDDPPLPGVFGEPSSLAQANRRDAASDAGPNARADIITCSVFPAQNPSRDLKYAALFALCKKLQRVCSRNQRRRIRRRGAPRTGHRALQNVMFLLFGCQIERSEATA